jgi:hypothetical protein
MNLKPTLLILFGSLLGVSVSYAQQTATLKCDISKLKKGNEAEVCHFEEAPNDNPETYTIEAILEEEITWSGKDGIQITKVKWYKGTKIFNGNNPSGNGVIKAQPKKITEEDKPYRYKLKFNVNGEGNYKIDPIIKVRNP